MDKLKSANYYSVLPKSLLKFFVMKKFKLKLFLMSALLLTLSSGLLFYKNIFISEPAQTKNKNLFEELHYLDLKINELMAIERRHLDIKNEDVGENFKLAQNHIHDLIFIILDLHHNNQEIKNSIRKIETYFTEKSKTITNFQKTINELRHSLNSLMPLLTELHTKKIKFSLDGHDLSNETMSDILIYLLIPSKDNELKLLEDKKILTQVIAIAATPEPLLQEYSNTLDEIILLNNDIEEIFINIKQKSINDEMSFVSNYFQESLKNQTDQGQSFLILVFITIIFYIASIIIIFRKL